MADTELSTREQIKVLNAKLEAEQSDQCKTFLDYLGSDSGQELKKQLDDLQNASVPGGPVERNVQDILTCINAAMVILPQNIQQEIPVMPAGMVERLNTTAPE